MTPAPHLEHVVDLCADIAALNAQTALREAEGWLLLTVTRPPEGGLRASYSRLAGLG